MQANNSNSYSGLNHLIVEAMAIQIYDDTNINGS
jgi:hypothetical protein